MANITVSSDVDTMLQSANNAAIRTNTGTAPVDSPVFLGSVGYKPQSSSAQTLVDIKKLSGKSGARVGINMEGADPKCALQVQKSSSDGRVREALRVTGGAYITEWVKIGNFTDAERDSEITSPEQGLIIYNKEHHEWQGYREGPSSGWVKFDTSAVST